MKRLAALISAILASSPGAVLAELPRIGAAAAVQGRVTALAAERGAADRAMSSGKTLFHKDRVATDAQGRMQVLLLDETVFTIGPGTELILDEFVYDPFTSAGKVAANVTKGAFRFVTGKVARKEPGKMKINLPVGTIGIRGTMGRAATDGTSAVVILDGPGAGNNTGDPPGALSVTNAGVTVDITRPGFATEITSPDSPPTPPAPVTPEQEARVSEVAPKAESGGGSEEPGGAAAPSEESGQATAEASGGLQDTQTTGALASTSDAATASASSDIAEGSIADGDSTWDNVRTIASGQAHYSGSGSFNATTCNGATCANNSSGSFSFTMNIDFGARTYGGDCSAACGSSSFSASDSDTAISGGFISTSGTINLASFAALSGGAVINDTGSNSTIQVTLINSSGVAADKARATVSYSDTLLNAGSGSLTADRFDGPAVLQ